MVDVSRNPYWEQWGDDDTECQQNYVSYLNIYDEADVKLFSGSASVIGDDDFKAVIRIKSGRPAAMKAGRPRKKL